MPQIEINNKNCLATTHPELAMQWHAKKNGKLKPHLVTAGTNRKAWWKCSKGHEWDATIYSRGNGVGCPFCSGRRTDLAHSIATTHPDLAKEWHPTKNKPLRSIDVSAGSGRKVHWKCSTKGHVWQATVGNRTMSDRKPNNSNKHQNSGCPYCYDEERSDVLRIAKSKGKSTLDLTHSSLAKQWHPSANELRPCDVVAGSSYEVIWVCPDDRRHEWPASVYERTKGRGCPFCSGRLVHPTTCLAVIKPDLAKEWHPVKNGTLTPQNVTAGSRIKIWWLHRCGHSWEAAIYNRISNAKKFNGSGCPKCSRRGSAAYLRSITTEEESLIATHPQLVAEWHTDNAPLKPDQFTAGSNEKLWWYSEECGHKWQATIKNRATRNTGCPFCAPAKNGLNSQNTTSEFVSIAEIIHHGKGYRYGTYHSMQRKMEIECPIHGIFCQTPANHLHYYGCRQCSPNKALVTKLTNASRKSVGIYKHNRNGTWISKFRKKYLGSYKTKQEALQVRKNAEAMFLSSQPQAKLSIKDQQRLDGVMSGVMQDLENLIG